FSHDALMRLIGAFHAILKFVITLWQFSGDDACPSGNVPAQGGNKKYSLTDLKLIKRHDTPSPNTQSFYIPSKLKMRCYEFCLLTCRALAGGSHSGALGVWDRRKARRRCMLLTTAARRSASCF